MAVLLALFLFAVSDESALVAKLKSGTGQVELPAGVVEISREMELPSRSHDLIIRGAKSGTVLRASPAFQGRAIFVSRGARKIRFEGFSIEGNRAALSKPQPLAPSDVPFSKWTRNNGILLEHAAEVTVVDVKMSEIAGFAVLVNESSGVHIQKVSVEH